MSPLEPTDLNQISHQQVTQNRFFPPQFVVFAHNVQCVCINILYYLQCCLGFDKALKAKSNSVKVG